MPYLGQVVSHPQRCALMLSLTGDYQKMRPDRSHGTPTKARRVRRYGCIMRVYGDRPQPVADMWREEDRLIKAYCSAALRPSTAIPTTYCQYTTSTRSLAEASSVLLRSCSGDGLNRCAQWLSTVFIFFGQHSDRVCVPSQDTAQLVRRHCPC
ncbi:hypothetical protein K466DRAFT_215241 [Polyporus arcularius HHB13444]|uniref:Uncharacterized protein n=1 Tax=Polyporus arcularius HHB13444 TaxID=1314778 RepID=A0A5C3P5F9_9APHY|nr:hypothetical protein K466DRAFT_215241 [Polyporus arcularius HHB13444]